MSTDKTFSPLMELEGVSLQIGQVRVLRDISLRIPPASFVGVVGERGAGKSSLLKILTGAYRKSSGSLRFEGKEIGPNYDPSVAFRYGILAVYQDPMVVPALNAWQNIYLNRELKKGFLYDHQAMHRQVREAFKILSIDIDPDLPLARYNRDQHLLVEFARILCFASKLVCVDDISSRLTPSEQEKVFSMLSALLKEGVSIVYFSNSLIDVLKQADRIMVLQNGEIVDEVEKSEGNDQLRIDHAQFFTRSDLERKNLELFYLQLFHESIINSLPLPILVLNARQEVVTANTAFLHLFGATRERLKATSMQRFLNLTEDKLESLHARIRLREESILENVSIPGATVDKQFRIHCVPIFRKETYFGMVFLFEPAKGASMVLGKGKHFPFSDSFAHLTAKAAHEINNPLGIILNHIQLIKSSSSIEEVRDSIAPIEKEINRIKRIIRSLMEIDSSLPETQNTGESYYTPLSHLIPELTNLFAPALKERRIRLLSRGERPIALRIREDECRQLLLNIIMNSIEAMPEGGDITITYGETRRGNKTYGYVSVLDTGVGIKKDILPKIFDLFFSTKTDKHARGIGLSICKDIVERYEGWIEVSSEEGQGAEFIITVPLVEPSPP